MSDSSRTDETLRVEGTWFAPGSAQRRPGALSLERDILAVASAEESEVFVAAAAVCSTLGEPVTIDLPGGGSFVVALGQAATPRLVERLSRGDRLVRRWERSRTGVALSLLGAVGLVALLLLVVLPAAVRPTAYLVPEKWVRIIDDQTLLILENQLLEPSALPEERQQEVESDAVAMISALGLDASRYSVRVWSGEGIGANAFALPGGTVIVTDDMVELAESKEELLAVVAHEVGHVEKRHGLQQVLRGSAMAIALVLIGPDPSAIANLASGLPAVFLESGYSRDFEREADAFACDALVRLGVGTQPFADVLGRLDAAHPEAGKIPAWISSHPDTVERIKAIRSRRDRP